MTKRPAFFLYGIGEKTILRLRESASVVFDATGLTYADIVRVYRLCERSGFQPVVYVTTGLPTHLTESWMKFQTTGGLIRQGLRRSVVEVTSSAQLLRHAKGLIEAATSGAPKEPTEVDRLKQTQQQDVLLQKKRQSDEMLAAKIRELEKKATDAQQKRDEPKK